MVTSNLLNWPRHFGDTKVFIILSPLDKWPDLIVTGRLPVAEILTKDKPLLKDIPGNKLAAFALIWCEQKGGELLERGKEGEQAFIRLVKQSIDLRKAMGKIDALVGLAKVKDLWPLIYHQTSWHAWFLNEGGMIELTPSTLARMGSQNIIKDFKFGPVSEKIKEMILEVVAKREEE